MDLCRKKKGWKGEEGGSEDQEEGSREEWGRTGEQTRQCSAGSLQETRFTVADANEEIPHEGKGIKGTKEERCGSLTEKQAPGAISIPRTEGAKPEEWR